MEVYAPETLLLGHCAEFDVVGGYIQKQISPPCNEKFPKCDFFYFSSDIYKYPDCYELAATPIKKTENTKTEHTTNTTVIGCVVVAILALIAIKSYKCGKQICNKRRQQLQTFQTEEHEIFERGEENRMEVYKSRQKKKSSNMTEMKLTIVDCKQEKYQKRCHSNKTEEIETFLSNAVEFEKDKRLSRRIETEKATTTDRYCMVVIH